jgi:hypothetical protein
MTLLVPVHRNQGILNSLIRLGIRETPSKTLSASPASSHSEIEKNCKTIRIFLALQICLVR